MNEVIKNIPSNIASFKYLVTFSYETKKGYYREQQRYVRHINKESAKIWFTSWSDSIRTMFNVKILSIDEIENSREDIEL